MTATLPDRPAPVPVPHGSWAQRRREVDDLMAAALALTAAERLPTPLLLLDPAVVAQRLAVLQAAMPGVGVLYAVKANPHPAVLAAVAAGGAGLDVASAGEVAAGLSAGVPGSAMSFGHPMKSRPGLRAARSAGVPLYAVDAPDEVDKVAAEVPGAAVVVRLTCEQAGADWPLAAKFGVPVAEAVALLRRADAAGLRARGVAFHVGSQQRLARRWSDALTAVEQVLAACAAEGLRLDLVDVGGGLPAVTGHPSDAGPDVDAAAAEAADVAAVAAHVRAAQAALGPGVEWLSEPGRYLVAEAGVLVARVVGVAVRDGQRWAYLDAGVFHGLVETEGEVTRYPLATTGTGPVAPTVLAGPTCDSADVLYRRRRPLLPALAEGDLVAFGAAGAYSTTYSSVSFNGFDPVGTVVADLAGGEAGQQWWAGAGSNRRPSAFQADARTD